jgi:hypothetical protein
MGEEIRRPRRGKGLRRPGFGKGMKTWLGRVRVEEILHGEGNVEIYLARSVDEETLGWL